MGWTTAGHTAIRVRRAAIGRFTRTNCFIPHLSYLPSCAHGIITRHDTCESSVGCTCRDIAYSVSRAHKSAHAICARPAPSSSSCLSTPRAFRQSPLAFAQIAHRPEPLPGRPTACIGPLSPCLSDRCVRATVSSFQRLSSSNLGSHETHADHHSTGLLP